ncbi:MAG: adenylyl-sulfate reductase subunit alpha [Armatimonadota bacterium]|nr:adenylyl-sulfate reductase subunit alpha [Armatimonadota bacterium]MDW8026547.1 adenylyl-sulfate reductase subunit alpha [Armatimonadota bacterium]
MVKSTKLIDKVENMFWHEADFVIVGGGTSGCMAAIRLKEILPRANVVIVEKANIVRSGCLAAGLNAINAYIHDGETPESFVRYVRFDAMGLIREDLVLTMAARLNEGVKRMESYGLPIAYDNSGKYLRRGRWGLVIFGEKLKPILSKKCEELGVSVLNRINVTGLLVHESHIAGVVGFDVRNGDIHVIRTPAVIVATGGAAGLYRPNNPSGAHHTMWYCPFNVGTGYAIGLRVGAEMTSFEMRFVALRTKDVIAPTGTLALLFKAPIVNSRNEHFMRENWGHFGGDAAPTCIRAYAVVKELKEGRGPCFFDLRHVSKEQLDELYAAYLDMFPSAALAWASEGFDPQVDTIEVCTTEPYIVGGHCQSGYWIDERRKTTVDGLYACGDVAGGAPFKFISGAWAEALIAAESAVQDEKGNPAISIETIKASDGFVKEIERLTAPFKCSLPAHLAITPKELELRLQKIMDEYAGGISTFYETNEALLKCALKHLKTLREQSQWLVAKTPHELMLAHEVLDRIEVAEVVVAHLLFRRETRWACFQTRTDYPNRDDINWLLFVNSRRDVESGELRVFTRPYRQIVSGDRYLP